MTSDMNTPVADKGISHGEELERAAMNTAVHGYLAAKPKDACPWQGYDNCRNCGLYGKCFTLEAQHGEA